MAAHDMFEAFTAGLAAAEREGLRELIASRRADMLAARSEDARVRITEDFIREARASLAARKK